MKTPINNNLDHLFNKAKADKQDLDDFEKEALAGFDLLESEQEAQDLKASLDTRIQKELFTKEEKNNPKIYWLAAAGLALVIGLSTFFVMNNNNSLTKNENLAITNTQEIKPEVLPESAKELKEQTTTPIESAAAADQEMPAKEIAGKAQADEKEELKNLEQKTEGKESKKVVNEPGKGMTSRSIPTMVNAGPKDVADSEQESDDRKKESNKSGENKAIAHNEKTAALDDLSKTNGSKGKDGDAFKSPIVTQKQDQNVNLAQTESNSKDLAATKTTTKEKSKEDKNTDADAKINSDETVAANGAGYKNERREENRASKKAKKSNANQSNSAATIPATIYNDETPGSPNTTTTGGVNNAPIEDKKVSDGLISCYYSGGESVITKDLKEKLAAQNLDQKFDATLYINENKAVAKVEFTNGYDLTKKQKEEVTKILKTLCKFNFSTTPIKKGEYPYKISYRP